MNRRGFLGLTVGGASAPSFAQLEDLADIWRPPEKLTLSEWAEKNFVLSPEYSAKSGLIILEPGQKEIFDSYTDPTVSEIALMIATQTSKTIFLQVAAAYTISEDPGPILMVSYKDSDADKLSKERFTPMIRDIAPLRARVSPAKSRDSSNTIDHKVFPGGTLDFVGSLSPANLARRTIRVLLMDEIDKYDLSSGNEGDPLTLAKRRTARYGSRRKIVYTCSPTIRGQSRIAAAFEESDQRRPYVKCHECGDFQLLKWTQVKFNSKLPPAQAAIGARYECVGCGALWTDIQRRRNIYDSFEWRPHAPFTGKAGFHMSHLHSVLPLHSIGELTREFLEAVKKPERLKVFVNTDLAELWEDEGERPDHEKLMARAESFNFGQDAVVPWEASCVLAGVDVQAKRLEMQVLAFGLCDGSLNVWSLDYQVIECFEETGEAKMTSAPEYWTRLGEFMEHKYRHATGVELPIIAMAIDVGHNPEPVYTFARRYAQPSWGPMGLHVQSPKTALCVRGFDAEQLNAIHRVTERETARHRKGPGQDLPIITLGTGYLKQQLYSELLGRAGENRIHISRNYPEEFFRGLVAEKRVVTSTNGRVSWEKIYPRNEPLDTYIYAQGAFAAFKGDKFSPGQWDKLRTQFGLPLRRKDEAPGHVKKPPRPTMIPSPYLS